MIHRSAGVCRAVSAIYLALTGFAAAAQGDEGWTGDPDKLPWLPHTVVNLNADVCGKVETAYRQRFLLTGRTDREPDLQSLPFGAVPESLRKIANGELAPLLDPNSRELEYLSSDLDGDGTVEPAIRYTSYSKVGSGTYLIVFESYEALSATLMNPENELLGQLASEAEHDGLFADGVEKAGYLGFGRVDFNDTHYLEAFEHGGKIYFVGQAHSPNERIGLDAMVAHYTTDGILDVDCVLETSISLEDGPGSQISGQVLAWETMLSDMFGRSSCRLSDPRLLWGSLKAAIATAPWTFESHRRFDPRLHLVRFAAWGEQSVWNWRVVSRYDAIYEATRATLADYLSSSFDYDAETADRLADAALAAYLLRTFSFGMETFGGSTDAVDDLPHTLQSHLSPAVLALALASLQRSGTRDAEALGLLLNRTLLRGDPYGAAGWLIGQGAAFDAGMEPSITYAVGHPELIALLVDAGAEPNAVNPFGKTALMYAAQFGDVPSAQALLNLGAQLNPETTALHVGCHDAGPNSENMYSVRETRTALDYAIQSGSQEMIDLLREHGALTAEELAAAEAD